eukprot:6467203-Amphidinium_carterae.1
MLTTLNNDCQLGAQASWTSNIASSAPAHVEEILDLLVHRDAFVYMGHGEGVSTEGNKPSHTSIAMSHRGGGRKAGSCTW